MCALSSEDDWRQLAGDIVRPLDVADFLGVTLHMESSAGLAVSHRPPGNAWPSSGHRTQSYRKASSAGCPQDFRKRLLVIGTYLGSKVMVRIKAGFIRYLIVMVMFGSGTKLIIDGIEKLI